MPMFSRKRSVSSASAPSTTPTKTKKESKKDAKKEETPLEKMLASAGPIRADGSDKFFGLENFGSTCYGNAIVQCLYYNKPFRDNIINYPPQLHDNPNVHTVNVSVRPIAQIEESFSNKAKTLAMNMASKKGGVAVSTGQLPAGQVRPEDRPEAPEYKKKHAMLKGPVLDLDQGATKAYGMDVCAFTDLKDIFTAVVQSNNRMGVLSPARLSQNFAAKNIMFNITGHQDAHEFYGLLLNEVISDVDKHESKRLQARAEGKTDTVDADGSAVVTTRSTPKKASDWVHEIFEGELTATTRCLACESISQRDEKFIDISIDLETHSSVTACLQNFSAEELLCEQDKYQCDRCGGRQEAERAVRIKRLPKVLAVHLKRFQIKFHPNGEAGLEKLFWSINYPYQLRVSNTDDNTEDPDRLYELYAVVVHIGHTLTQGHYVAVIKTPDRGWMLFDDEMVEPVDNEFARQFFGKPNAPASAYVLFYQETTFEKMAAEQEAEGHEKDVAAGEQPLSALDEDEDGEAKLNKMRSAPNATFPIAEEPVPLATLTHAVTEPASQGQSITTPAAAPPVPAVPVAPVAPVAATATSTAAAPPAALQTPQESTAQSVPVVVAAAPIPAHVPLSQTAPKDDKKAAKAREKEAKATEKERKAAEKVAEKERAKEAERLQQEKSARRREIAQQEARDLVAAMAASKQMAAEESAARSQAGPSTGEPSTATANGNAGSSSMSPGFLNRSSRGSKSLSRKSMGWLNRSKSNAGARENGDAANGHATTEANGDAVPAADDAPPTPTLKGRFGFGRKKSTAVMSP